MSTPAPNQLTKAEPRAINFPEANFTYSAPPDLPNCVDLPCFRATGVAVSCWYFPSWRERLRFLVTGKLWFYCLMNGHPPMSLTVDKPPFPAKPTK